MTVISSDLFNTFCTILTRTEAQDADSHEMVETWANAELTVTEELIGVGNASTKVFYTDYDYVSEVTNIYVNGVLKTVTTDYAVTNLNASTPATITFVTAPALNAQINCGYKHKDSLTIPCRLDVARGGVQVTGKDYLSRRTHILYMDYRTDITWKDKRITVGTETFDIILPANAGGESDHLELNCEIVE